MNSAAAELRLVPGCPRVAVSAVKKRLWSLGPGVCAHENLPEDAATQTGGALTPAGLTGPRSARGWELTRQGWRGEGEGAGLWEQIALYLCRGGPFADLSITLSALPSPLPPS